MAVHGRGKWGPLLTHLTWGSHVPMRKWPVSGQGQQLVRGVSRASAPSPAASQYFALEGEASHSSQPLGPPLAQACCLREGPLWARRAARGQQGRESPELGTWGSSGSGARSPIVQSGD